MISASQHSLQRVSLGWPEAQMATFPKRKRRGPAAAIPGEGVVAVLAAALEMDRTGSAELHPPSVLTDDEPNDASGRRMAVSPEPTHR
jgi:hypothetical protein